MVSSRIFYFVIGHVGVFEGGQRGALLLLSLFLPLLKFLIMQSQENR